MMAVTGKYRYYFFLYPMKLDSKTNFAIMKSSDYNYFVEDLNCFVTIKPIL